MTEELLRKYGELRAHKLGMTGAERWNYINRVVQYWLHGFQAEAALSEAAREVGK